jgi:hypothetical protein
VSDDAGTPTAPSDRPGLFLRLKGHLSLSRAQTIFGLIAALLSIGGTVYGYLKVTAPPDIGEVVAVVRDRNDKPVPDATVEVLTPKDALVTSFSATEPPTGRHTLKEGTYRLRVTHPKFATETRTIEVLGGQTSEVRFRLGPRVAATPPPPTAPSSSSGTTAGNPVQDAAKAVNESVEAVKKIFR